MRPVALLFGAATFLTFLPLPPVIAGAGLDYSWNQALHAAIERELAFGTDIVFTYGPLGFAHTRIYWPGLFAATLAFWAVLAIGIVDAWAVLARRAGRWGFVAWPVLALACGFAIVFANDAFVLFYLLLWVVMVDTEEPRRGRLAAHAGLAGVIALSKFTFAIASGLAVLAVVALLAWRGRPARAGLAAGAAASAFIAGWLALSQPLGNLPAYVLNSLEVVVGYSEAMAWRGGARWETNVYGAVALLVCGAIAWALLSRRRDTLWVTGLFTLAMLALMWKQVFTRHDIRSTYGFAFLMLAAFVIALRLAPLGRRPALAAGLAAVAAAAAMAVVIDTRTQGNGLAMLHHGALRPFTVLRHAMHGATGDLDLRARHEAAMARIRADDPVPALPGTVDVYSYEQSTVFAHGLRWNPRPVFQSYQAYTADLAELNRKHLLGARAPDHILWRIQAIDGRYPALEDGASWLAMLERYALRDEGRFVVLDRQPNPAPATLERLPPSTGSGWRELPPEGALHLAAITIDEPPLDLMQVFKRPVAYEIQVRTAGEGAVHGFRFLRSAGRAPFVLSPLVLSNADFASLFLPCGHGVGPARVEAVRILGPHEREVPFTLELQVARELPHFASAGSALRATACRLQLVEGPASLRSAPFLDDGGVRGLNAHPPATFRFTAPATRARVCTRLFRSVLEAGKSDGYTLEIVRDGASVAQARVTPAMLREGGEACIEARFDRPVDGAQLRIGPGGHNHWDWVFITQVDLDG